MKNWENAAIVELNIASTAGTYTSETNVDYYSESSFVDKNGYKHEVTEKIYGDDVEHS